MKKMILPFFLLLIGAYFGYYLVMEDHPAGQPGDTNLVLRVTSKDEVLECAVSFLEDGKVRLQPSERGKQHLTFVGLPEGANTLRINYYEAGEGFRDIDIPLIYDTGKHFQLTVDPFSGTARYEISYPDYLLGFLLAQGPINLLRYGYLAAVLYITWVILPLIWIVTLYTLFREYRGGLRRRFAGSWVYLGIGCAFLIWILTTPFFSWVGNLPGELRRIVYLLLTGYPLYYLAYLVLDENKVLGAEYRLLEEYFTYEEFQLSDGGVANGFVASWQQNYIFGVIGWIAGALLLPLSTYMRVILYYVTPFFYGSKTWKELSPIEPPDTDLFAQILGGGLIKREPAQSDAEGAAAGPVMESPPVRRRRRRRRRPQRKTPYLDSAGGEGSAGTGEVVSAKEKEPESEDAERLGIG